MAPEERTLRRVGAHRRRVALKLKRQHLLSATALRFDIAHLLAQGHRADFDEGWPYHFVCPRLLTRWPQQN